MPFNPSDKTSKIVLSNGDQTVALTSGNGSGGVRALYGLSSGKWYCEFRFSSLTNSSQCFGFSNSSHGLGFIGTNANSWGLNVITTAFGTGKCRAYHNNSYIEVGDRGSSIVRLALDLDNKKAWYSTGGLWEGDPTDHVSGSPSHSFDGNSDTLFVTFFGSRDSSGNTSGTVYFKDNFWYEPPAGYLPMADGFPVGLLVISGLASAIGQFTTQEGGYLPVYLDVDHGQSASTGQITVPIGSRFDSTTVHLEHQLSGPTCLLQVTPAAPPVVFARAENEQSALVNRLLTGGRWTLGWVNFNWDLSGVYPYDNIFVGLVRANVNLDGGLLDGDSWMFSYGAWNSSPRLYRDGKVFHGFGGVSVNYNEQFSLALDFSDLTNGKVFYRLDSWADWPTEPIISGLVGAWYVGLTVNNNFEVRLLPGVAKSGFIPLIGTDQATPTKLYGTTLVRTTAEATLTPTNVSLIFSVGSHLLRSATWKKKTGNYYLGLLTSLDPTIEPPVIENGYSRQAVPVANEYWTSSFLNVQRFAFKPFDGVIVGWALFWYPSSFFPRDHDPVIFKRSFESPITCSASNPGPAFPPSSFSWSFE